MSSLFLIRAFAYLVLPLLLAGIIITIDKQCQHSRAPP